MAGYTPLFASLTTGSLCGRWPDIGLWPIVLSLADKHGVVDVTPQYISGVTGLALADVTACMKRFCEADPYSRSPVDDGAKLALLDDHRDWGWRIVNHGLYREKARLAMREIERVASGENRARMQERSILTPCDPRSPPVTPADPPSDSDSDSDSDLRINPRGRERARAARPAKPPPRKRCPEDFKITEALRAWASQNAPDVDVDRETEKFRDWEFKASRTDWPATWRTWMRRAQENARPATSGPRSRPPMKLRSADEIEAEELTRATG